MRLDFWNRESESKAEKGPAVVEVLEPEPVLEPQPEPEPLPMPVAVSQKPETEFKEGELAEYIAVAKDVVGEEALPGTIGVSRRIGPIATAARHPSVPCAVRKRNVIHHAPAGIDFKVINEDFGHADRSLYLEHADGGWRILLNIRQVRFGGE